MLEIKKKWPYLLMIVLVLILDQGSKYLALLHLSAYQPKPILPMLNMTLAYNTGAAFSFLSEAGSWHAWFFALFALGMSLALFFWLYRLPSEKKLQALALSLILGGAIGNLLDRAFLGHVVDFIDVYYQNHHWPIFNLADSAICLGAFFFLIEMFYTHNN